MRTTIFSSVRNAVRDQSGQTLPFVALLMTGLMGMMGLVIDVGHAYVIRGQLQNSANAAALAAAGYVYTSNSATVNTTTMADQYSAGKRRRKCLLLAWVRDYDGVDEVPEHADAQGSLVRLRLFFKCRGGHQQHQDQYIFHGLVWHQDPFRGSDRDCVDAGLIAAVERRDYP
jgi:hypothetical protein